MLYVERDKEGNIIMIHSSPRSSADEEKHGMDEEILDFLNKPSALVSQLLLSLSDMGIIRLLEDRLTP